MIARSRSLAVGQLENKLVFKHALKKLEEAHDSELKEVTNFEPDKLEDVATMAEMVNSYAKRVVELCDGNQTKAAALLGLSKWSLARRLKR